MDSWGGRRIDHVGIAVRDLEAALIPYRRLGAGTPVHREAVGHDGVEVAFVDLPGAPLELLSATAPGSVIAGFLERRGEGLHHLALEVSDIGTELAEWRSRGAELIDQEARPGARGRLVAFLHPRSFHGVLIELCQRT